MIKKFFIILTSLFILAVVNFFTDDNSLTAQPQWTPFLTQGLLDAYSLPAGPITENDIPRIKTVMQEVLNEVSESIKSAELAKNKADVQPIMLGVLIFQDWLRGQGCVKQVSNWYVETIDKYSDEMSRIYPGEVPFDIVFDMGEDIKAKDSLYRLMIFVNNIDLLKFASLIENRRVIVTGGEEVRYLVPSDE
ncbi:hypothetical protein OAC89_06575 [Deltaproteobacteria bacterium]|nr:hypothetical protein [Deltaproteobacteria bacterium]